MACVRADSSTAAERHVTSQSEVMSNALSQSALLAAVAEVTTADKVQMTLIAAGLPLLLIWVARRAVFPKNLTLSRSPGRPNTVEPIYIIVLLLVWIFATTGMQELLSGIARWAGAGGAAGSGGMKMRSHLLANLAGQMCWLAGCLFVATRTFPLGLSRGVGLSMRHWFFDGLRAVVACLAVYPVCLGLNAISVWVLAPHDMVHMHGMLTAMATVGVFWRIVIVFCAVVMAPLAEEVFFRGLLQSMLRHHMGRPWAAVTITSAAFAAVHWSTPQDLLALFALSLVLGYNYERTGRLVPAIAIHALFNTIAIVQVLLRLPAGG